MIIKTKTINEIPIITYRLDNDKKKPLIFFFHGFTGNKDTLMGRGEKLAELGFYVVALDAHLHGQRMPEWFKEISNETKYQYIIDIVIQTSHDAKYLWENHFKNDDEILNDGFYTYGVSMGAMTSFSLATLTNELKAMVTLVGSPSFTDYYLLRQKTYNWDDEIVRERLVKYKELDPSTNISKINKDTEIFIALGENDDIVIPKFAIEFYEKRKVNSTLKMYDTGHVSTPKMLEDGYNFLKRFI